MAEEFTVAKTDFQEWYPEVLRQADIVDDRYPIKGCLVWKGWGYGILRNIMNITRKEVDATGHDEVQFPCMVPEDAFEKEGEHIKGFESEVFWITHAGLNKLDRRLLLRPTSETVMYPMFSLWVRSHNDLPLKIYQIVNTFRYETKHTRPIIRVRELISFYESHTAHDSWEDAEHQVAEDIEIMDKVARQLCLPIIINKRPEWDKFPGAVYTLGVDTLFPDMRTLQIGTIHNLGDNFSKPFNVTYKDDAGEEQYAHITCYGMSERLVASVISVHGDDRGIVLPPALAPKQVVIVPIIFSDSRESVLEACHQLESELKDAGIRAKLDDRDDVRAGEKYAHWELRGVPVRLELGPKDMAKNAVMTVRRDNRKKESVPREKLIEWLQNTFDAMSEDLMANAQKRFEERIVPSDELREATTFLEEKRGIVAIHWCEGFDCAGEIERMTEAAFLGVPYKKEMRQPGNCIICGKPDSPVTYISKKY